MDVFRTPDERFENLPGYDYEPHYVAVDGLRLHHVDEGSGPAVLCFHGEPDWSYLYRHMLDALVASGHRVVCPDLVGFGNNGAFVAISIDVSPAAAATLSKTPFSSS